LPAAARSRESDVSVAGAARAAIRVLVVDDHPVVREGLLAIIGPQPDMAVVGQAGTDVEALAAFRCLRPDVTLMDLRLGGASGVDVTAALCREFPGCRVLVLTAYAGDEEVYQALRAGARGYLLKGIRREELIDAIRAVHEGGRRVPRALAERLAERLPGGELTQRERDVLGLMAEGRDNRSIARHLGLTAGTVKGYVHNVLEKLEAADRTAAVALAARRGLVHLDSCPRAIAS
jgi:DNA-binding NarL/FixJ family response regulator